jgi:hypothetical protein
MSDLNTTDSEIRGTNVFMGVLLFLSAVMAIAFLAGTSPDMGNKAATHTAQISTEQTAS